MFFASIARKNIGFMKNVLSSKNKLNVLPSSKNGLRVKTATNLLPPKHTDIQGTSTLKLIFREVFSL